MTIKFFKGINNRDELRKAYLHLMKANHPDRGGDTEICKAINNEYDFLSKTLPASAEGQHSTRQSTARDIKIDAAIKTVIDKLMHMSGIRIEVVGAWLWIDGNSYQWKSELTALGFKWSKNRKKWHFTPYNTGWYKGGRKTFEQLRAAYGSMVIDMPEIAAIAG